MYKFDSVIANLKVTYFINVTSPSAPGSDINPDRFDVRATELEGGRNCSDYSQISQRAPVSVSIQL